MGIQLLAFGMRPARLDGINDLGIGSAKCERLDNSIEATLSRCSNYSFMILELALETS
jgi:hypothetical protein